LRAIYITLQSALMNIPKQRKDLFYAVFIIFYSQDSTAIQMTETKRY